MPSFRNDDVASSPLVPPGWVRGGGPVVTIAVRVERPTEVLVDRVYPGDWIRVRPVAYTAESGADLAGACRRTAPRSA